MNLKMKKKLFSYWEILWIAYFGLFLGYAHVYLSLLFI